MALQPLRNEELNYLKLAFITVNEFPKALRQSFKDKWDAIIGHLPGYQLWDDSTAVRNMFCAKEGGKTKVPTNLSYNEWDCTDLFQATIYARSFSLGGRTLCDLYVKPRKLLSGSFHPSVVSTSGNDAETFALAIDQLRRLRNEICHSVRAEINKLTFHQYVQHAENAFNALKIPTAVIKAVGSYTEDDFPTDKVRKLEDDVRKELQAENKFIKEEVQKSQEEVKDQLKSQASEMKAATAELKKTTKEMQEKLDETTNKRDDIKEEVIEEIQKGKEELNDQLQSQTEQLKADTTVLKETTGEIQGKLVLAATERQEMKNEVSREIQTSKEEIQVQLELQAGQMKADTTVLKKTTGEIEQDLEEAAIERQEMKNRVSREIQKSKEEILVQLESQAEEMNADATVLKITTGQIQHKLEEAAIERDEMKREVTEEIQKSKEELKQQLKSQTEEIQVSTEAIRKTTDSLPSELRDATAPLKQQLTEDMSELKLQNDKLGKEMHLYMHILYYKLIS